VIAVFSRRYERLVPKHLRTLGEANGAPKPNRFLPSIESWHAPRVSPTEGGAPVEAPVGADADVIPDETRKVLVELREGHAPDDSAEDSDREGGNGAGAGQ
jgi:hypothetical protein